MVDDFEDNGPWNAMYLILMHVTAEQNANPDCNAV